MTREKFKEIAEKFYTNFKIDNELAIAGLSLLANDSIKFLYTHQAFLVQALKEYMVSKEELVEHAREVMFKKQEEYSSKEYADIFANFDLAGRILNCSKVDVCKGYMTKHTVSISMLSEEASKEVVLEKCGDLLNYLIILEALLLEAHS